MAEASSELCEGSGVVFQPFGYRFELESPSSPSAVKAAIRSRKKGWFDRKDGPRGWIAGSFICLWFSVFDRHGPMLFGRISDAGLATRVRGRAGSNLDAVIMFPLLMLLMAFLVFKMASEGAASASQLLIIAVVFLIGGPLIFWSAHKDKREAEPLVRFLRDAVTVSGQNLRAKSAVVAVSKAFTLNIGGEVREGPVTPDAFHDALLGVGAGDFVILERGPETYIQTAFRDGGYILEMRDGDGERHFQALRRSPAPTGAEDSSTIFTFEEVREAFMACASEAPLPHFVTWERMRLLG